jgi:hypothetical protein
MPASEKYKEEFKNKLLTITPKSLTSGCVYQLDKLFEAAKNMGIELTVKSWWVSPFQTYQYVFRYRLAEYMLQMLSGGNEIFIEQCRRDLELGGLYFAIANWLDWNNEYDLHNRYNSKIDLTKSTGWVLKYPLPILGAASAVSNSYMSEAIQMIPLSFRKDACQTAADLVRREYKDRWEAEEIDRAMYAAHRALNDVAQCKINGYPLD